MSDNVTGARSASLSTSIRHLNNLIESTQNVTFYNQAEKEKQYLTSLIAFKKAKDDLIKKIGLAKKGSEEKNNLQKELEEVCNMLDEFLGDYPIYITLDQLKEFGWTHIPTIPKYDVETSTVICSLREMNSCDIREINKILHDYKINTPNQIAHFFSQIYDETQEGSFFIEGGDYIKNPVEYYTQNHKYGHLYRGSGGLQLTWDYGYANYYEYQKSRGNNDYKIVSDGALYVAQNYPLDSAAWFWVYGKESRKLNEKSKDINTTVKEITEIIKGAADMPTLSKRQGYYNKLKNILGF